MKRNKFIIEQLDILYPNAKCELNYHNNYELLIAVVLSAQTTDKKVNEITPILFKKYKNPKQLSLANIKDVEKIIKPIGLYHNKANNIITLAKELVSKHNSQVPDNRIALEKLKGVGRKTANIILSNCFNENAFAVDTHVSRISKRLNIANKDDNSLKIEEKLMMYFPKNNWSKLHHQFIMFGRYKCKAINPDCLNCPFKHFCNY